MAKDGETKANRRNSYDSALAAEEGSTSCANPLFYP